MLLPFYIKGVLEAGCDEAGRGPLAGSVFAAAVILPPEAADPAWLKQTGLDQLNDSKQLNEHTRYELRPIIERYAKQKRLSPDPFPVARRSNSDRQSGSSPGFGSSRPDAFPCSRTVAHVGRSPSQWRDRAGL